MANLPATVVGPSLCYKILMITFVRSTALVTLCDETQSIVLK